MDFLPFLEMQPALSADEVASFVRLGELARERLRAGDPAGAREAYLAQISVFSLNYEPYVALALLEAMNGDESAALGYLRDGVLRGFADLRRIERAEAWTKISKPFEVAKLVDAASAIQKLERTWPDWGISTGKVADDLEKLEADHARVVSRFEMMSPVLGPRLTSLWDRLLDRVLAARIESFVDQHPDSPLHDAAVRRVMTLWAGDALADWGLLPAAAVPSITRISRLVLDRTPESDLRPLAQVALALAWNTERDRRGKLTDRAADQIRTRLEEVLEHGRTSPVFPVAAIGLVRTESESGHDDRAAEVYRRFVELAASDSATRDRVRSSLGPLGLKLGGLPDFVATTLDGRTVGRDTLRGQVAVIDFWATWCRPCIDGFDALRHIEAQHAEEVVVLGVNLDSEDQIGRQELAEWIAREGLPGDQVHDGQGWESELVRAFGVREIPFTVVVGADGEILSVNEGKKRLERTVIAARRVASASP